MTEKEYLNDALSSQKFISGNYDMWAGECVLKNLRDTMLNILDDEHCIQAAIFNEMSSRGWYDPQMATEQEITLLRNKLQSNNG